MAVKNKRKQKRENSSVEPKEDSNGNDQSHRKSKRPKRLPSKDKQQDQNQEKTQSKRRNQKSKRNNQKNKKPKKEEELNASGMIKLLKESFQKFKQMIFWGLILSVMFYLRFSEEGFGAFQKFRTSEDLYKVLESESHFTKKQIKTQYRKLVNEFHPDKNPNCKECEEKITKINKAYEILKSKESRKIYDETKGVVNPIRSSAKSLNSANIRKEVLEAKKPVVIQIYADNDEKSRQFSSFWEDFMVEHSYLNFARINMTTEPKLANSFEFGVEELPFVFSYVPNRDYEFFEFDYYMEGSTMVLMKKFLKKMIKRNAEPIGFKEYLELERDENMKVVFVRRESSSLVFESLALSMKGKHNIEFYSTHLNEHKKFYRHFKNDNINYILLMPKGVEDGVRVVYLNEARMGFGAENKPEPKIENDLDDTSEDSYKEPGNWGATKSEELKTSKKVLKHYLVGNYIKSQIFPKIFKHSFINFCKTDFTSFDGQIPLPTMSILVIKGTDEEGYKKNRAFIEQLKSDYEKDIFKTLYSMSENVNAHVHRYQFGELDIVENSVLYDTLIKPLSLKNPKVLIYLSDSSRYMLLNNFQDLEDILEDSKEGIFQDYRNFKSMMASHLEFEDLLKNENIGFFDVLAWETQHLFWKGIGFLVVLLIMNNYLIKMPTQRLVTAFTVMSCLFLAFLVIKQMKTELIW